MNKNQIRFRLRKAHGLLVEIRNQNPDISVREAERLIESELFKLPEVDEVEHQ